MADARVTDTGAEIRAVELWVDDGGVPARIAGAAAGAADGISGSRESLWHYALVYNGVTWDRQRTPAIFKVLNLAAGTAETIIWTPATGKKFRLMGLALTAGVACDIELHDGAGGSVLVYLSLGAAPLALALGNGILSGAANRSLTVVRSASTTLKGIIYGTEE